MQNIKIGGHINKDEVKNIIDRYFSSSNVYVQEEAYDERYEFSLSLKNKRNLEDVAFYRAVANLVQEIILKVYIRPMIIDRVMKICDKYSLKEKEEIVEITHQSILNEEYYTKEKAMINEEILNHLIENNKILIDGFMSFRLRRYIYIIDISVEKAIGEIEVEKEYLEFLNMLQYFVEIQDPKYDLVHVIIEDGDYILLDEYNELIENGVLEADSEEIDKDISKADILVSSLIIFAPSRIILHVNDHKEEELVNIISQIFGENVKVCNSCQICNLKSKEKRGEKFTPI